MGTSPTIDTPSSAATARRSRHCRSNIHWRNSPNRTSVAWRSRASSSAARALGSGAGRATRPTCHRLSRQTSPGTARSRRATARARGMRRTRVSLPGLGLIEPLEGGPQQRLFVLADRVVVDPILWKVGNRFEVRLVVKPAVIEPVEVDQERIAGERGGRLVRGLPGGAHCRPERADLPVADVGVAEKRGGTPSPRRRGRRYRVSPGAR